jgi:hypothetical protein
MSAPAEGNGGLVTQSQPSEAGPAIAGVDLMERMGTHKTETSEPRGLLALEDLQRAFV